MSSGLIPNVRGTNLHSLSARARPACWYVGLIVRLYKLLTCQRVQTSGSTSAYRFSDGFRVYCMLGTTVDVSSVWILSSLFAQVRHIEERGGYVTIRRHRMYTPVGHCMLLSTILPHVKHEMDRMLMLSHDHTPVRLPSKHVIPNRRYFTSEHAHYVQHICYRTNRNTITRRQQQMGTCSGSS